MLLETPAEEPAARRKQQQNHLKSVWLQTLVELKTNLLTKVLGKGLEKAKADLGIEIGYIESKQDADYEPNLETLVDGENDLIWGVGFKMADAILAAAGNYPEQEFCYNR